MNKPQLPTLARLIELRNILDTISQISWSFSILNKKYPVDSLDEQNAILMTKEYERLVAKANKELKDVQS